MATFPVAITDGLGLKGGPAIGGLYAGTLASTLKVHDTHLFFKGASVALISVLHVRDAVAVRARRAGLVTETVKFRSPLGVAAVYERTIHGGDLDLEDLFGFQHAVILHQAMRFGEKARATLGLTMAEALGFTQSQARTLILNAVVSQGLDLHDVLGSGYGMVLRDAVRLADQMTRIYCAAAEAADVLEMADQVERVLQAVVICQDSLALDDATLVRMMLRGELVDGLDFSLGVAEPGGGVTTWAMNTRTGSVTEYVDFAFTSFAPFGNSYLGVGKDGLYELLGDDDAGTPIVADMISGLAQMTGSQLGSFKAAYVAMRGEGEFYLRLTADETRSTTYRVLVQPLRTARVDMGKGWRARYFSFQLISSGQDFDLSEIEFLPIAATRRI